MESSIIYELELHKKWIETTGEEGEKLNLNGVNFRNFNIDGQSLQEAYVADCTFDYLSLKNVDFYATTLCSSTYRNANIDNCNFCKSDLAYANFSNASIRNVTFSKSDCFETIFNETSFFECNLVNISFYLTNFTNARLSNVDISASTFKETLFSGAELKNIVGIEEAHFESINIGTLEQPILLKSEKAKEWIVSNCR